MAGSTIVGSTVNEAAAESACEDVWVRTKIGWHAVFAMFAVVAAVLIIGDDAAPVGPALVLLGALCAWYAATGARVLHGEPQRPFGVAYVVVAVPLVVALFAVTPIGAVMLSGLYPQFWALLYVRHAVVASACTTFGVCAVLVVGEGLRGDALGTALVMNAVGLLVAVLLGVWINKIIEQSRKRAALVTELEATRAELAAVSHDAGVLAERERLARDLHDTVAQGFTSVLILLQAAQEELRSDAETCRAHLALAEQTTRENLAEIRALVAALTPAALTDAPLPAALERLTDRLGRELGVTATMAVVGQQRALPSSHEVVLLRSTQEALANVRKHAGASQVNVQLHYDDDFVTLQVRDDGRGFDPPAQLLDGRGFGLQGLRDRVRGIGGSLAVQSAPGAGVIVRVHLPCLVSS